MGDTASDFWISFHLDKNKNFYFVNPDKKVIKVYDDQVIEWVNYHLMFERKDLIFEMKKQDITIV
jgi:hypothetical protein